MATRSDEKTAGRGGARRRSAVADASLDAVSVLGAAHPSRLAGGPAPETHLRPFSQTAEVPAVARGRRAEFDPRFAATGMVAAYPQRSRRRSPLWFQLTLWTMLILMAAAGSLIGVHHFRPSALRAIESASAAGPTATGNNAAAGSSSSSSTSAPGLSNRSTVALVTDGATGTATVPASQFDVVIVTQGACWVSVTDPGSTVPVFAQTLQAGAQQVFPASNGGLVVDLGSSHVTLSVQIKGKKVAGSDFTPTAAPFTLTYSSSS